jgi:hypothetical protein
MCTYHAEYLWHCTSNKNPPRKPQGACLEKGSDPFRQAIELLELLSEMKVVACNSADYRTFRAAAVRVSTWIIARVVA